MRKILVLLPVFLLMSCQPHAFFAPTGPKMDPVPQSNPVALYCTPPLPPYCELGFLLINCPDNKCKNLSKYTHRLGANGIVYSAPDQNGLTRLMLIERNWPLVDNDLRLNQAQPLQNDQLTCK